LLADHFFPAPNVIGSRLRHEPNPVKPKAALAA